MEGRLWEFKFLNFLSLGLRTFVQVMKLRPRGIEKLAWGMGAAGLIQETWQDFLFVTPVFPLLSFH